MIYLHLPVMLVLVSLVYSATRYDDWDLILGNAIRGCVYIVTFLGSVFVVLWFLSVVVPAVIG
ncbi:MAG: hypothetical protein NZM31_11905 [Gemmatales bacterium]|nr:hypothetical protein [Gemmatales bacterium]MDW8387699.1 hypothetical protein [Gemmatales bacterium]